MYQLINQSDTEMIKIISSSDFFNHKTNNIDPRAYETWDESFSPPKPCRQIWRIESERCNNIRKRARYKLQFVLKLRKRFSRWVMDRWGRKEGGGLKRVKGQPLKCWCTNDGPSTAAPCANLTEGITSLVNGCPSYGSRVTTVPPPLRSYDAPERSMDFQNLS